jgi:hypothetical protein
MLTRRMLLKNSLKASAAMAFTAAAGSRAYPSRVIPLSLGRENAQAIPPDFIGFGYEMSSVASLGLLSPSNDRYLQLVNGLSRKGVIRIGGIVADYTSYTAGGAALADRHNTVINHASLDQFAAFLRKISWTAIWSLNFAQGSLEDAVEEARAVSACLGSQLLAIELGNEVENYALGSKPFRKSPYTYERYRAEYSQWRSAILRVVPGLSFAAPDTASNIEWVERMATETHGDVQLLTTHYYRNGQTHATVDQLLDPDPRLKDELLRLRTASQRSGIPWRMCETNSFSGGGRPGLSDTIVGALWTLDYMLLLARYGCAGVNIETGMNQLGFVSSYSPIQDDGKGINTAGIPYYGMLAFAHATANCSEILPIEIEAQGVNITAYAAGTAGKIQSVVIVNRDNSQQAGVSLQRLGLRRMSVLRLLSLSPHSGAEVTFGGAAVDSGGRWASNTNERLHDRTVNIPPMSAAVLRTFN